MQVSLRTGVAGWPIVVWPGSGLRGRSAIYKVLQLELALVRIAGAVRVRIDEWMRSQSCVRYRRRRGVGASLWERQLYGLRVRLW